MKVLVTGGAGYIGSTICSALIDEGHIPIILDSLVNGRNEFTEGRIFYKGDIADTSLIKQIFIDHTDIDYVIHCAALIVVPDSVNDPYDYYTENVVKSISLFKTLLDLGCNKIVFSSSASIYDDSSDYIVDENSDLNPRSPYAMTKYIIESVLKDFCNAYDIEAIILRYFNPIGADPKMRTGAYIKSPSHILGKLISAYEGKEESFKITGTHWKTRDGTGIRDYIHVWDLARAHLLAVENFKNLFNANEGSKYQIINLGNGKGVTVRELVSAFQKTTGKDLKVIEAKARQGDVPGAYANADKAKTMLGWEAQLSIEDGIENAITWSNIWKKNCENQGGME